MAAARMSSQLVKALSAVSSWISIVVALRLAPRRPFLRIELAAVVAVDLVEPLAIELVALLCRHRRQPVVIGLAALDARLLRSGKPGGNQLMRQPRLALLQVVR